MGNMLTWPRLMLNLSPVATQTNSILSGRRLGADRKKIAQAQTTITTTAAPLMIRLRRSRMASNNAGNLSSHIDIDRRSKTIRPRSRLSEPCPYSGGKYTDPT